MFCLGAFVLAAVGQEFWRGVGARRAITHDSRAGRAGRAGAAQPAPLRRLHRPCRARGAADRRRRRPRRSSTRRTSPLTPGQSATLDGYTSATSGRRRRSAPRRSRSGRSLDVTNGGSHVTTLTTTCGLYPSAGDPSLGAIGRFFNEHRHDGRSRRRAHARTSGPSSTRPRRHCRADHPGHRLFATAARIGADSMPGGAAGRRAAESG